MSTLRRSFLTGLVVLAPLGATGWVFYWLFRTIDDLMRPVLLEAPYLRNTLPEEGFTGIGVVTAILFVIIVGLFANNLLGRAFFAGLDQLINRIPWIKGIYRTAKEISGVVFTDQGQAFRKVILFEYPRRGLYSIGFVTMEAQADENSWFHVFLPTTPNPTSGYFLMVPQEDARVLPISVEHGLKLIISAGAVVGAEDLEHVKKTVTELASHESES